MIRSIDMILLAAMVTVAGFTYTIKHKAESTKRDIKRIERQISLEEDRIDVLHADWSLSTQPAVLQKMAQTYKKQLELEFVDVHQFADIKDIPLRPLMPQNGTYDDDGLLEALAITGTDQILTGSIGE